MFLFPPSSVSCSRRLSSSSLLESDCLLTKKSSNYTFISQSQSFEFVFTVAIVTRRLLTRTGSSSVRCCTESCQIFKKHKQNEKNITARYLCFHTGRRACSLHWGYSWLEFLEEHAYELRARLSLSRARRVRDLCFYLSLKWVRRWKSALHTWPFERIYELWSSDVKLSRVYRVSVTFRGSKWRVLNGRVECSPDVYDSLGNGTRGAVASWKPRPVVLRPPWVGQGRRRPSRRRRTSAGGNSRTTPTRGYLVYTCARRACRDTLLRTRCVRDYGIARNESIGRLAMVNENTTAVSTPWSMGLRVMEVFSECSLQLLLTAIKVIEYSAGMTIFLCMKFSTVFAMHYSNRISLYLRRSTMFL